MRHGCLASREERLEYCKGYEDWQEEHVPRYIRWTHRESTWEKPLKLRSETESRQPARLGASDTEIQLP